MPLPLFLTQPRRAWANLSPAQVRWVRRVLVWVLIGYVIRYVLIGLFYKAAPATQIALSVLLLTQTITLYYTFAHVIIPRTLFKSRIGQFFGWLVLWQFLIYQSNYWVFYWLHQYDESGRLAKDWAMLNQWGPWGGLTSGAAIFWNIFWSFVFPTMFVAVRVVIDIIQLRTRAAVLEKEKLALELDFLKAQVNPHFLFNTLNNVYSRVFDTDEEAADLLLRLSELMRYNLYETDQPQIDLPKELAYIQNYLDLERNRLAGRPIEITYTQTGTAEGYHIAPLLLIAFVENAFKHGVKGATQPAYVHVRADVTDKRLIFSVENSVPPSRQVADDPVKKSGGVGLVNVRRRLNSLYPHTHRIVTLRPDANHYAVTITLPLRSIR